MAVALAAGSPLPGFALPQDPPAVAGDAPQEATPQVDLLDVWHAIRHEPGEPEKRPEAQGLMIAAAPIIGWNPTFGQTFGAAAQVAWVAGDPAKTRISSSITSLSFSTKGYTLFSARFDLFSNENEWFVEGDNRFYNAAQNVYGLGTGTPDSAAFDTKYHFFRVHDTAYRRMRGAFYLGGGLLFDSHTNVAAVNAGADPSTSAYVAYSQAHGLPVDSQQSGGISVNMRVDRRVGEIDSRGGWLVDAFYRMSFDGFLGGDSGWQLAHLEFRGREPDSGAASPHDLDLWRPRHQRRSAVLRAAGHGDRQVRTIVASLPGGAIPRGAPGVRRGRIPRHAQAGRPPRHGGVRQRRNGHESGDGRKAIRLVRAGCRGRPACAVQ